MTKFSELASPAATRDCLKRWGLHTKKSLGQHFLVDDHIVGKILTLANIKKTDNIIEVGPGIGTLTLALLKSAANIVAIEKDIRLLDPLSDLRIKYPTLTVINIDALAIDALQNALITPPNALIANLPYSVAASVVLLYFERLTSLEYATVMVQREVANRMCAQPNSKAYGAYTVKLQLLVNPTTSFSVARSSFMPPPRVDSTVIKLDRHSDNINQFEKCVIATDNNSATVAQSPNLATCSKPSIYECASLMADAAFAQRRKTIRNSMHAYFATQLGSHPEVDAILELASIDPGCRAESLSVVQYQILGQTYNELLSHSS